jgi:hypothetical protein
VFATATLFMLSVPAVFALFAGVYLSCVAYQAARNVK